MPAEDGGRAGMKDADGAAHLPYLIIGGGGWVLLRAVGAPGWCWGKPGTLAVRLSRCARLSWPFGPVDPESDFPDSKRPVPTMATLARWNRDHPSSTASGILRLLKKLNSRQPNHAGQFRLGGIAGNEHLGADLLGGGNMDKIPSAGLDAMGMTGAQFIAALQEI